MATGGPAKPLVIVTRAREDAAPMLAAIASLGAEGFALPCVEPAMLPRTADHDHVLKDLGRLRAVAFASRHAAEGLHAWLTPVERRLVASRALFAVGPATGRAVAAAFGRTPVEASPSDAYHLLQCLLRALPAGSHSVLLPAAKDGRRVLLEGLRAAGHVAHFVPIYETRLPAEQAVKRRLWPSVPAYILFGSPSAVVGFLRQAHFPLGAQALSIGPATSQALAAHGLHVSREAPQHDARGLLATLAACLQANRSGR